jgi:hypothetical protein
MHFSYLLYQAGRVMSPREQLEADARAGQRAKSVAQLWHSLLPARRQPARYETLADEPVEQSCVAAARWS